MSGHSKWATIKRQKGVNDTKRGQVFTKLSAAISIAVREGGGVLDPASNFKLRLAIDAARSANMPKENIERAIKRATGKQEGQLEGAIYEGFGPGGVSVIVQAATDNKQRTISEIKSTFDKNGGSLGVPGAVSYQFSQKGLITLEKNKKNLDEFLLIAAEAGAEDVEEAGDEVMIYTQLEDLNKIREVLQKQNLSIKNAEFIWKPLTLVKITDPEKLNKIISLLEKLEDLTDVQKVYANFDLEDQLI